MFGYVLLNRKDSTPEERKTYQEYYCGLCRALSEKYGKDGEACLSFDMTFLYLLLSDLYNMENEKKHLKCTVRPVRGRDIVLNKYAYYCADMQILLSYYSAQDNVRDKDNSKAEKTVKNLGPYVETLKEKYPEKVKIITERLVELDSMEKRGDTDIIGLSNCFSSLLGEIFAAEDDIWADKLRAIGSGLGRFVYIMDAYDDLEKDKKKGNFNPLITMSGEPDFDKKVKDALEWAASDAAAVLETLPLMENLSILRNIIYSGIWATFEVKKHEGSV